MKISSSLPVVLACLTLLSGCRGGKHGTEALEQELRHQEKKIWTYTTYIEDYQRLLDDCRDENKRLRERLGDDGDDGPRRLRFRGNESETDGDSEFQIPEIEIPMGDQGSPEASRPQDGPALSATDRPRRRTVAAKPTRGSARLPTESAESQVPLHDPPTDIAVNADPRAVETLQLNNLFTGGNNTDGVPGDEGISLLIETRNAQGDVIPPGGELDISLLDPSAPNEAEARVGLWRLTAQQVRERFRDAAVGKGVKLELPWQRTAPRHEKLRLFVRFTRPDGERIQTDRDIEIELPGRSAAQQRRRRFLTARTNRLRAMADRATQDSDVPNPGASSAPLWQGGNTNSSEGSPGVEPPQPKPLDRSPSGWSQSRRGVPTHPTPERLLNSQPSPRSATQQRPEQHEEKPSGRHTDSRAVQSDRDRSSNGRLDSADSNEPKIVVREPASRASDKPQPSRPPERTTLKPRPWSPYR